MTIYTDKNRAQRMIDFIETLTIPEGMHQGKPFALRPWQKDIIRKVYSPVDEDGKRIVRKAILSMGKKNGKGLALDTPIPTPSGWTTMGDISNGDILFDEKGNSCRVEFTSDIKNIYCYEVEFSNGEKIVCDEQHLWKTTCLIQNPGTKKTYPRVKQPLKQVRNIVDIFKTQKCVSGINNHSIDIQDPIKCSEKKFLLNPYVLGVWLGDGDSDNARINCGDEDLEEMLSLLKKEGVSTKHTQEKNRTNWRIRLSNGNKKGIRSRKISNKLRVLNLYKNKHIPKEYLRGSTAQRTSLLQGLMDTDGTCDKKGRAQEFCTINKKLLSGVCELLSSLGIKYSIREKKLRCNGRNVPGIGYYVQFCCLRDILPVFRIKRKLNRQKNTSDRIMKSRSRTIQIVSVKKVDSVPTKCIRVDSPNSLFLCGKTMIPTHNTPLIAALALCHLIGPEAKRNEQMNSAAFERDQAGIVYKYMENMINADEELKESTIIRTTKKEIEGRYTGSIYKALSAEAKSKHGISPAFLAFDELAQFKADRVFYDTLTQGFGAHDEPILWIISTQAEDDLAVLSQEIDYALKSKDDPSVVLFLYTTPAEDEDGNETDLMDRESWKLSNPALNDFLSLKDMESKARNAVDMPSSEPGFRNLRLNQRVAASSRFMSPALWKKNGALPNHDALFKGRITAGLDLSQKNDLSALVLDCFYEGEHNIFPFFWRPLDNIRAAEKKDRVPYVLWHKQGLLEAKPGEVIDFRYIAEKLFEIHMMYGISQLNYDRWHIKDLILILNDLGCETHLKDQEEPKTDKSLCVFDHGQGTKSMTPAITYLEDAFIEKRVRHGNNPILTMCAANAVIYDNPTKGKRFEKDKSTGKIDGIVAMAMAMNGAELPEVEEDNNAVMPIFL